MKIRRAELSDCASLARIQVNSYRSAYAGLMPVEYLAAFTYEEQEQDWVDLIQTSPDLLLAAENEEGQVVGYALSRQTNREETGFDCELVALHVNRDQHKQGFGRALVSETARQMNALGCRSLGLWVLEGNPASGFYQHLGGSACGEQTFEIEELNFRYRETGFVWGNITDLFSD